MAVLVLNTHDAIKRPVKAGQDEKAAIAIVELITDTHEQVATKSDIELLEHKIAIKLYTVGTAIVGILAAFKYWG